MGKSVYFRACQDKLSQKNSGSAISFDFKGLAGTCVNKVVTLNQGEHLYWHGKFLVNFGKLH